MCRAIRVVLVSSNEDLTKQMRAAVGVEAEVIAVIAPSEPDLHAQADVVVVDGSDPVAAEGLAAVLAGQAKLGVIWVGSSPPASAHAVISDPERLRDELPSAIVKALIARR